MLATPITPNHQDITSISSHSNSCVPSLEQSKSAFSFDRPFVCSDLPSFPPLFPKLPISTTHDIPTTSSQQPFISILGPFDNRFSHLDCALFQFSLSQLHRSQLFQPPQPLIRLSSQSIMSSTSSSYASATHQADNHDFDPVLEDQDNGSPEEGESKLISPPLPMHYSLDGGLRIRPVSVRMTIMFWVTRSVCLVCGYIEPSIMNKSDRVTGQQRMRWANAAIAVALSTPQPF